MAINNPSPWRFDGYIALYNLEQNTDEALTEQRLIVLRGSIRELFTNWNPSSKGPFLVKWKGLKEQSKDYSQQCSIE